MLGLLCNKSVSAVISRGKTQLRGTFIPSPPCSRPFNTSTGSDPTTPSEAPSDSPSNVILFALNGKQVQVHNVEPGTTLLQYLRSHRGLTGTKLGCEEGGCGACTVQLSRWDKQKNKVVHFGVNSCLAALHAVDGHHIITVEGIGNVNNMHPIQEQIAVKHGSQCGFCTPGIVMALHSYLSAHPDATKTEIEHSLDGNLCRCTGYRSILDAAKQFGCGESKTSNSTKSNSTICPSTHQQCDCGEGVDHTILQGGTTPSFPEYLKNHKVDYLKINGRAATWLRPLSVAQLLDIKAEYPMETKIVGGSTELSIEVKFKHRNYPILVSPLAIPEMTTITVESDGINVGASASLSDIIDFFLNEIKRRPLWQTSSLQAVVDQLRWFGGPQIKNVATLGGNIATASPISDVNPILMAVGAKLRVQSKDNGARVVDLSDFFVSYRTVRLLPTEVIVSIFVPFSREGEFVRAFKQARRREDDIAIVSACFRVLLEKRGDLHVVKEASLAYGGMDAITKSAQKTGQFLINKAWNPSTLQHTYKLLEEDLPLPENAVGGMVDYRRTLSTSFWFKFFLFVNQSLGLAVPEGTNNYPSPIPPRPLSSGLQTFPLHPSQPPTPVGSPIPHVSAKKQVTGEATYIDDIPMPAAAGYGCFVISSKARAKILKVNPEKALKMEGVLAYFSAKDIPGHNDIGTIYKHEPLFATDEVQGIGYPIGLIVATDHRLAEKAALAVEVEYEELPHLLSIPDAIRESSYWKPYSPLYLQRGELPEKVFPKCDHIIEGEMAVGGQDQFYLEPHVSHAVPGEDNEMIVYASTQNPSETQLVVSEVLGVPANRVVCKVKRLGGGFGGKETRSIFISCAAALAAKQLKIAVRIVLDRDEDMQITGGRHPFLGRYKVGFNSDGKIQALDIDLYSNGGWSMDLSAPVMERALFHVDNVYYIPHVHAKGFICKTNIATNTAFRGFGGPQSMLICESWIERISKVIGVSPLEVRRKNMYLEGQETHYRQQLKEHDATASKCWDELMVLAEVERRMKEVEEWNKNNKFLKKGIAIIPTKFGMSFTARHLNQAGALVHIYQDGSVLVTHGGTEMGQGLHTKLIQVAATELGISIDNVYISETSTDKVPNTSPTAASVQSDLNGGAVLNACKILNERLEPFRKEFPTIPWKELIKKAYFKQVDLSAHGFYNRPHIGYDWKNHSGEPFAYFVTGAACSEVQLDTLTGDHQIIRSDIIMDIGQSLSPAIDIGQIEGAFTQGFGWSTIEEVVYLKDGQLHSRGPGAYKLPGFQDIPIDFRVHLLKASNPTTIYSSKGIGEPPLFLGTSVFFALKEAIYSYRKDNGLNGWFPLSSPATCERLRMSCKDDRTHQFKSNTISY